MLAGIPAQVLWRPGRKIRRTLSDSISLGRSDSAQIEGSAPPLRSRKHNEYDLRQLNDALEALCAIFPDVRAECFREMLSTFSEESRLELVTESLLKNKARWVRGRWRVPQPRDTSVAPAYKYRTDLPSSAQDETLPVSEQFRSAEYKSAVKAALYQEFKGLNKSTVKAVLAEYNYSYTEARPTLIALYSKSWRFSVSNLFIRRKPPSIHNHPLVTWQASQTGELEPTLRLTTSEELNQELQETLIDPYVSQRNDEQLAKDRTLAEQLNETEAEESEATFECGCCFVDNSFEKISICSTGSHYLCFRCLQNTVNEAIYGQGWAKNINSEKCTLKCVALAQEKDGTCDGVVPQTILRRALDSSKVGRDAWAKLEERVANEALSKSQMSLVRCPFCSYAETQEPQSAIHSALSTRTLRYHFTILITCLCMSNLLFESPISQLLSPVGALLVLGLLYGGIMRIFAFLQQESPDPLEPKSHGRKFICRNLSCARASCQSCQAPWRDIHICHESERKALRAYVESAMADAVKRTCPKCNLSFVKASGCNKLTCVCGYAMCYVCRSEIGKENYQHFCPHFRPHPGTPCTECQRCDLYRNEDEDAVIQEAKAQAEKEWWEQEGKGSDENMKKGLADYQANVYELCD